jgi:hypothetical protein
MPNVPEPQVKSLNMHKERVIQRKLRFKFLTLINSGVRCRIFYISICKRI